MLRVNEIAERLRKGMEAGTGAPADMTEEKVTDPLVITPSPELADLNTSGSASIDLRLGTWFVSLRQARMPYLEVDDPSLGAQFTKDHYVRFGDSYFLHPRSFVLGTTLEWIRLPRDLMMYGFTLAMWFRALLQQHWFYWAFTVIVSLGLPVMLVVLMLRTSRWRPVVLIGGLILSCALTAAAYCLLIA